MKSSWNEQEAEKFASNPLQLRVYTSRLLGLEPSLVLHGGGNTSVKATVPNFFGEKEEILFVKGSGWDLATIEAEGFAPVKMETLLKMADLPVMTDSEMVREQRAAMTNPGAPNPSVEAILHAIIPFDFVDHTHTDAVVTITNTPDGEQRIKDLYGNRVIYVPYVMPGFILAREINEATRDLDWTRYEGMVLLNHGLFTFSDSARESYENMIRLVNEAEEYLVREGASFQVPQEQGKLDLLALSQIRKEVSDLRGAPMLAIQNNAPEATFFSKNSGLKEIANRGPITPDHIIRTKQVPVIIDHFFQAESIRSFADNYKAYFDRNNEDGNLTMLDPAPRWGVWEDHGLLAFGRNVKECSIIGDISHHTIAAIQKGEILGGWRALPEKDLFEMEYWELEQAKLRKSGITPLFAGKVALVTGAASGIGKACVEALLEKGAAVAALDLDPRVTSLFGSKKGGNAEPPSLSDPFSPYCALSPVGSSAVLGLVCDITDREAVKAAVRACVAAFGGIDILVSNAGFFAAGQHIEDMDADIWEKSLSVNLTGHQAVMQEAIPFLKNGIDPSIVVIASKNVPAPGPGAAAYSAAKAGLTQLARVAALELGASGIRVNMLHPDAVYDTGIWSEEVLNHRAAHYGMTVSQYKTRNILKAEVTSVQVAELACALASPLFCRTTGAQIPIDGGNERVI